MTLSCIKIKFITKVSQSCQAKRLPDQTKTAASGFASYCNESDCPFGTGIYFRRQYFDTHFPQK